MRRNGKMTAALLAVAVAAVGCSQGNQSQSNVQETQRSAKMTPVSMTTNKPVDNKKLDVTTVKIGPASFTDGESAYKAGNYTEATRIFEQYSEEKPKNA